MTAEESRISIFEQNKTVNPDYLYVWVDNAIGLTYISQFLPYLERTHKEIGFKWKYDSTTKTIWKFGEFTNQPFPRNPNESYYDPMNPTTLQGRQAQPQQPEEPETPRTPKTPQTPVTSTILGVDFSKPSNIIAIVAVVLLIVVLMSRSST